MAEQISHNFVLLWIGPEWGGDCDRIFTRKNSQSYCYMRPLKYKVNIRLLMPISTRYIFLFYKPLLMIADWLNIVKYTVLCLFADAIECSVLSQLSVFFF